VRVVEAAREQVLFSGAMQREEAFIALTRRVQPVFSIGA
jgi:hypothetical protein